MIWTVLHVVGQWKWDLLVLLLLLLCVWVLTWATRPNTELRNYLEGRDKHDTEQPDRTGDSDGADGE